MDDEALTDLDYEILDTVVDADETTALIFQDIHQPINAHAFSAEAKALDSDALEAVFNRLAQHGLVDCKHEATDGFAQPRPGLQSTWWSMTDAGHRTWESWAARQPEH